MEFTPRKLMTIAAAALATFAFVAGLLLQLLPGPRKDSDYLVAGAVATAAALAVCFAAILTDPKTREIFFKDKRDSKK
jgi:hypothetical protein